MKLSEDRTPLRSRKGGWAWGWRAELGRSLDLGQPRPVLLPLFRLFCLLLGHKAPTLAGLKQPWFIRLTNPYLGQGCAWAGGWSPLHEALRGNLPAGHSLGVAQSRGAGCGPG